MQVFTTSQAYSLWTLLSLLESPPIVNAIPDNSLFKLGTILMAAVLKKRLLDIQSTDLFAKVRKTCELRGSNSLIVIIRTYSGLLVRA